MIFHVLTLATRRSCFPFVLGRRPPVCLSTMDTILRLLEGLRRDEIVWLNTYLTGRLRAMPPPAAAAATAQVSAGPAHADIAGDSVDELPAVALAERVGDFNISMDPWEQTGAAPQGWATHLHQTASPSCGQSHRLIDPATSSTTAFRWECIRSRGAVTRCMPITRKIHQTNRPTRTVRRPSG